MFYLGDCGGRIRCDKNPWGLINRFSYTHS
jgi:hypothetical protein